MASPEDLRAGKAVRQEFSKRGIDATYADVRVTNGVCTIRGTVRPVRGSPIKDVKIEMELIARVLRHRSEIRDVILDCQYRG